MSLDDLYQEVILDHFRHPRCRGCCSAPDASATLFNPLCGDQIDLTIKSTHGILDEIAFQGQGCSISQASASMMATLLRGKRLAEADRLFELFRSMMRGEKNSEELPELGDAIALEGVRKFSARVKCAMLAWEAAQRCIGELRKKHSTLRVLP